MSHTIKNRFKVGDLVRTIANQKVYEEKEWYGVILDICPNAPKKYPILADKYKVKWVSGGTSWIFSHSIDLVSGVQR